MITTTAMITAGSISFDHARQHLKPDTAEDAFADSPAAARASVHHGPGSTAFNLPDTIINGARFHAVITFKHRALASVELCLLLPNDSTGWAGWSLENEMHRKSAHEHWAAHTFSSPLKLKLPTPAELPDIARRLAASRGATPPDWMAPDDRRAPLHAIFPWGEVVSLYDDRSACSRLRISYNPAS